MRLNTLIHRIIMQFQHFLDASSAIWQLINLIATRKIPHNGMPQLLTSFSECYIALIIIEGVPNFGQATPINDLLNHNHFILDSYTIISGEYIDLLMRNVIFFSHQGCKWLHFFTVFKKIVPFPVTYT